MSRMGEFRWESSYLTVPLRCLPPKSSFIADVNFALSCTSLLRASEPIVSCIYPSSLPRLLSLAFLKHLLSVYSLPVCSCSSVLLALDHTSLQLLLVTLVWWSFSSWFFTQLPANSTPLMYRSLSQLLGQPIALSKEIVCCSPGPRLPSYP